MLALLAFENGASSDGSQRDSSADSWQDVRNTVESSSSSDHSTSTRSRDVHGNDFGAPTSSNCYVSRSPSHLENRDLNPGNNSESTSPVHPVDTSSQSSVEATKSRRQKVVPAKLNECDAFSYVKGNYIGYSWRYCRAFKLRNYNILRTYLAK